MPTLSSDGGSPIPVEAVSWESYSWEPRFPQVYFRAEVKRQTGPYEASVPPSIAMQEFMISASDIADVEDATRALVAFDSHARATLGAGSAALSPMSAILLRTESASSSQIERLTTSARQLALAEIEAGATANANTVLGNVRAMEAAVRLSDDISVHSVLAMHRELMRSQHGMKGEAGRFRNEQVWIGPGDAGPRTADFVPPHHERVETGVTDVLEFARRDDLPVLVQVAVAHAQFETMHPFSDGNGRTGRALAQSMIRNKGLVTSGTVPISAGLLVSTDRYFSALGDYRNGDGGPIIRRFAEAARVAAVTGKKLVNELFSALADSNELLHGIRSDATARKLLPHLIAQPVINTNYLVSVLGVGEMAALRALDTLTDRGVLVEKTGRLRDRVWEHPGILDVLDDYAEAIRRMAR
ncbi:Fic family protein [Brevibacterium daeguense]|uniref:Fic family protein n=1 Tax=Brevibacterium daeguense TaxID=909936 RepID=A0ABP8EG02_9MICO|nr:Fic family protein [Brevibacterium daeguense]